MLKIEETVRRRIDAIRTTLSVLERAIERETEKPFSEQPRCLLDFLYKERCVYEFALSTLEGLVGSGNTGQCDGTSFESSRGAE